MIQCVHNVKLTSVQQPVSALVLLLLCRWCSVWWFLGLWLREADPFGLHSFESTDDAVDCPGAAQPQDDKNLLVEACAGLLGGPSAALFYFYPSFAVLQAEVAKQLLSS